jgi:hypothetical protein
VQQGVTSQRSRTADAHWVEWTNFATQLGIDSLLQTVEDKIPVLQVFAERVRTGRLSRSGNPINARSVEDYLRSIGQTFLALGTEDPRYTIQGKMDFRLTRMISAWKKTDPPPDRVKPVPVQVLRRIALVANAGQDPMIQATSDMIILGFFFLLRPGEYTDSPSDTAPFRLCDVQLFIGDRRLNTATATIPDIQSSTFASLTFTNQKNGVRGEVIGLGRSGCNSLCPVRAIIRRVRHLRHARAPPTTPLARVHTLLQWRKVTPSILTTTLRQAVSYLGPSLGFLPKDVSARCLRAAGANALLCAKVDGDVIRLLGRWRSDEMLRYLHLQAGPIMQNFSRLMLSGGAFSLIPNQLVPQLPN